VPRDGLDPGSLPRNLESLSLVVTNHQPLFPYILPRSLSHAVLTIRSELFFPIPLSALPSDHEIRLELNPGRSPWNTEMFADDPIGQFVKLKIPFEQVLKHRHCSHLASVFRIVQVARRPVVERESIVAYLVEAISSSTSPLNGQGERYWVSHQLVDLMPSILQPMWLSRVLDFTPGLKRGIAELEDSDPEVTSRIAENIVRATLRMSNEEYQEQRSREKRVKLTVESTLEQ
jgi:hypothetical protein